MKHLKTFNESLEPKSFIWIHGLPGSGKTTLANKIMDENPDKRYVLLDDVGSNRQIIEQIDKGSNIILSSPYFDNYMIYGFDRQIRDYLSKTDYSVEELWFENNPQKCIENIKNRKGHHINVESLLPEVINFSNNYKIPVGVKQIRVFSNEVS